MTASHTTPVTLNSFQGPSVRLFRSVQDMPGRAAALFNEGFGRAARWMLKQVQHDEAGKRSVAPVRAGKRSVAPVRGGGGMTAPLVTTPVTLNLFQGPSVGLLRSAQDMSGGAGALLDQGFGRGARWMLKRVQHDEAGKRSVAR